MNQANHYLLNHKLDENNEIKFWNVANKFNEVFFDHFKIHINPYSLTRKLDLIDMQDIFTININNENKTKHSKINIQLF